MLTLQGTNACADTGASGPGRKGHPVRWVSQAANDEQRAVYFVMGQVD